jgi:hypothetical protein
MDFPDHPSYEFVTKIPGFTSYWATHDGRIYSYKTGKREEKTLYLEKCGYVTVGLTPDEGKQQKRYRLHVIMAKAWLTNSDNLPIVNHKDGNKQNNHIGNLEYVSQHENVVHAYSHSLIKKPVKPVCQYDLDGNFIAEYESINEAAIKTNLNPAGIGAACKQKKQCSSGGFLWYYKDKKPVTRNHGNAKYVLQYTKDGKFVAEYKSAREASEAVDISIMSISLACRGKHKTAAGFVWKYKETEKTEEDLLEEEVQGWVELKDFPGYKISKDGRIYSKKYKIIMKTHKNGSSEVVGLCTNGTCKSMFVHRLVALAYIPNPQNYPVVNHIDGNQYNNIVENLEWCTHSYNTLHAHESGLLKGRKAIIRTDLDGNKIKKYKSIQEASKDISVSRSSISAALRGKSKSAGGYKWRYA